LYEHYVVLVGQPQFADLMNQRSLRQLKQRMARRFVRPSLNRTDTAAYIASRVHAAGGQRDELFTSGAIDTVFEHAHGTSRTIMVNCDNALVSGFAAGERPAGRKTVLNACHDFDLHPAGPPAPRSATRDSSFFLMGYQ
jgi:type II secretory pathway predicted ATPase ExeA